MRNEKNVNPWFSVLVLIFLSSAFFSQKDSMQLKEVIISSYLGDRPVLRLPASVALIDGSQMSKQPGQSLVPVLNTVP